MRDKRTMTSGVLSLDAGSSFETTAVASYAGLRARWHCTQGCADLPLAICCRPLRGLAVWRCLRLIVCSSAAAMIVELPGREPSPVIGLAMGRFSPKGRLLQ